MQQLQIQVMNGKVGMGDRILWHSKRYGIRKGEVIKICQTKGWRNNKFTYITALPDHDGAAYPVSVPLTKFEWICKEFTPEQVTA